MKQRNIGLGLILVTIVAGIFFMTGTMEEENTSNIKGKLDDSYNSEWFSDSNSRHDLYFQNEEIESDESLYEEDLFYENGDGGEDSDEILIDNMKIKILDMSKKTKKQITNYKKFCSAIKKYMFVNGIEKTQVVCLNSVTNNFDLKTTVFMMELRETKGDTGRYIYVIQNNKTGTYEVDD